MSRIGKHPNDILAERIRFFADDGIETYDIAQIVGLPVYRVRALKQRIPVDMERAVALRLKGLSENEIAYELGVSPSTVHMRFREYGIRPPFDLRRDRNNPGPMQATRERRDAVALWCPGAYMAEYSRLRVKFGAQEAKRIIVDQIQRDARMCEAA